MWEWVRYTKNYDFFLLIEAKVFQQYDDNKKKQKIRTDLNIDPNSEAK